MNKTIAILQSNYIPWKGYFSIIGKSDVFVFYDSVQFTKNDWRNRNQIQTSNGLLWLSVPVGQKISRKINEVQITEDGWQKKHYKTIKLNYQKAPYFKDYDGFLQTVFLEKKWDKLSDLNQYLIKTISKEFLNFETEFIDDTALSFSGDPTEKLLQIVKSLNGTRYLSGPAAKDYLDESRFINNGIQLEYIKYEFPIYRSTFSEFTHYVSVLDLLFHCGSSSREYIV